MPKRNLLTWRGRRLADQADNLIGWADSVLADREWALVGCPDRRLAGREWDLVGCPGRRLAGREWDLVGWQARASADQEWDPVGWQNSILMARNPDLIGCQDRLLADQAGIAVGWAGRRLAEADRAADLRKRQILISRDLTQDRIGWEGRPLSSQKGDPGQGRDMDLHIIGRPSDQCNSVIGGNMGIGDRRTVLGNSTDIMGGRTILGRPILQGPIILGWPLGCLLVWHTGPGRTVLGRRMDKTGISDCCPIIQDRRARDSILRPFLTA